MSLSPPPADLPGPFSTRELHEHDLRRRVKRELRKRLRGLRTTTPLEACVARSSRIIEKLEALDAVRAAKSLALFWPIEARHEVDLRPLDESLRRRGVRIAYPAIEPASEPDAGANRMTFRFVDDVRTMAERGFGFAEPAVDAAIVSLDLRELDVVVVPALAIDPTGQRIGYGAGYYDRAVAGSAVVKVGVIFDFQLISEVPVTDGDAPVDWIVTDARTLEAIRG
jgi:5-formyltetrahydrofolate cyclo-ligase